MATYSVVDESYYVCLYTSAGKVEQSLSGYVIADFTGKKVEKVGTMKKGEHLYVYAQSDTEMKDWAFKIARHS